MGCKGTHYFSNFHPIGRLLSSFKLLQCNKYAPKVALQLSGRMLLDGCVICKLFAFNYIMKHIPSFRFLYLFFVPFGT